MPGYVYMYGMGGCECKVGNAGQNSSDWLEKIGGLVRILRGSCCGKTGEERGV